MDVTMDIGLPAFQAGTLHRPPETKDMYKD